MSLRVVCAQCVAALPLLALPRTLVYTCTLTAAHTIAQLHCNYLSTLTHMGLKGPSAVPEPAHWPRSIEGRMAV